MPDADSAQLQRVDELGFADFVAMLLVETLDAIVASHTSQEERLRALADAADQTLEEFTENITDDVLAAALAQLFPDGESGTTITAGSTPPPGEALDALDIVLDQGDVEGKVLTAAGVRTITAGVRRHLGRTHLESFRRVAREGVPRVRVDGGVLRSKLTFSAVRRTATPPAPVARKGEPKVEGAAARVDAGVLDLTGSLAALRLGSLADRAYLPTIQRGVIDSIAGTRLTVSPALAQAGGGGGGGGGGEQTNATIFGEVEIHFHTEV